MSIEHILQSLSVLTDVHNELHDISKQKTEVLTNGATENLQSILIEEQTLIRKLEQAEKKREALVNEWFMQHDYELEERTITNILNLLSEKEDKVRLERAAINLTKAITQLRDSEQLNSALLQQSMHFIQASLNMLQPTIQSVNYDREKKTKQDSQFNERSMFDSRA